MTVLDQPSEISCAPKNSIRKGKRGVWWEVSDFIEEVPWLLMLCLSSVVFLCHCCFSGSKFLTPLALPFTSFFFFLLTYKKLPCTKESFCKCIPRAPLKTQSSKLFSLCWSVSHSLCRSVRPEPEPTHNPVKAIHFDSTALCAKNGLRQRKR